MKVLSLLQPWATLVAIGAKQIETRSWLTHYRGPLAIHASKGWPEESGVAVCDQHIWRALRSAGQPAHKGLPRGVMVCVCDLDWCRIITGDNDPPEPERSFGNYTPGRWAWHLANVRALPEPIPAKGARGLWTPEPDVLEQLERFYRATA